MVLIPLALCLTATKIIWGQRFDVGLATLQGKAKFVTKTGPSIVGNLRDDGFKIGHLTDYQ
jgi:hypothetical protein